MRRSSCSLAVPFLLLFGMQYVSAQKYTLQEAGVGVVSQTAAEFLENYNYAGPTHLFAGPEGQYTWNLSPSLAVEGNIGYLPGFQTSVAGDNGHELLAVSGVNAGLRRQRFGVYGKIEPGIASWSPGLTVYRLEGDLVSTEHLRRTNFALDYGGVLELYPTERTIIRFDLSQTMVAEYDQVLSRVGALTFIEPGHIAAHLGLGLSVAHRFGVIRDESEREPQRSPLDMGILFSLDQRVHQEDYQIAPERGGGAWVSYNFSRYVSLDGTAFYSPQDDHFAFPQDGGRDFMALGGAKAGIRRDRLGYFVKVRPGMIQFSRTNYYQDFFSKPQVFLYAKTTDFALDTGGVLEVYPVRHFILRAEAGNAFIHYHGADLRFVEQGGTTGDDYTPPLRRASILMLFGLGWRF